MARDIFRTREGSFRILITQIIDGKEIDWYLVDRRTILTPDKLIAHGEAVRQFVGREVEFLDLNENGGYDFAVPKKVKKAAA